ncbi:hypothetical protein KFL_013640020, partial [Klebsormidium nitens]
SIVCISDTNPVVVLVTLVNRQSGISPLRQVLRADIFGEFEGVAIRKTTDSPPKISIYDLFSHILKIKHPRKAWADTLRKLNDNGDAGTFLYTLHKFGGRGQNDTPVTDARGFVTILNYLSGARAAQFRTRCADTIVRYLGGDETLVSEIRRIREAQETMPDNHPMRMFGQDVEVRRPERDPEDEARAARRRKLEDEREIERLEMERERIRNERRTMALEYHKRNTEASLGILENLTRLPLTPAEKGLINGVHNTMVVRSAAHVTSTLGSAEDAPVEAPAAAALYGMRVTILEYGRDVLGLRGERLSSQKLSVVGRNVGTRWMQTPGKGSLVEVGGENGQKKWERTTGVAGTRRVEILDGQLTTEMLANNRIKFSDAYLGTNEVGVGTAFNVWTYPKAEAGEIIKEAFAA